MKMNRDSIFVNFEEYTRTVVSFIFHLGCSYDHLQVTFIEKVKHGDEAMLAKQELYWQYQLRSFRENGGNAMNIKDDLV